MTGAHLEAIRDWADKINEYDNYTPSGKYEYIHKV